MKAEEYARHFASLPDQRLVRIIDDADDTDPVALEAARKELARRGLSDEDLSVYRAERSAANVIRQERQEWITMVTDRIKAAATEVHRTLVLDPDAARAGSRPIRIMMIATSILLLVFCPRFLDLAWLADGSYDLSTAEHFLPLLILPLTLLMLWKRKRAGWFLGTIMTTWFLGQILASACVSWGRQPSGIFSLDELFPVPSATEVVTGILFGTGTMAAFQLRRSLAMFTITERERWLTVVPVFMLVWSRWYLLLG